MFKLVDNLFRMENPDKELTEENLISYMSELVVLSNDISTLSNYQNAILRGIYLVTRFVNENFITNGNQCLVNLSFKDFSSDDKVYKKFKANNNHKLEQLDSYSIELIGPASEKDKIQNTKARCMLYGLVGITATICNKAFGGVYDQTVSLKLPDNDSDTLSQIKYLFAEDFNIKIEEKDAEEILLLSARPLRNNSERQIEIAATQYMKVSAQ